MLAKIGSDAYWSAFEANGNGWVKRVGRYTTKRGPCEGQRGRASLDLERGLTQPLSIDCVPDVPADRVPPATDCIKLPPTTSKLDMIPLINMHVSTTELTFRACYLGIFIQL